MMLIKNKIILLVSLIGITGFLFVVSAANPNFSGNINLSEGSSINFLPSGSLSGTNFSGNASTANYSNSAGTATIALSAASSTNADTVDGWATSSLLSWANVTGRPGWLSGGSYIQTLSDANTRNTNSGFYENGGATGTNWPSSTWYNMIHVRHSNQSNYHGFDIAMSYYDNLLWFRSFYDAGFQVWRYLISSANIGSQSVAYANSAGTVANAISASNLNGYTFNQAVLTTSGPTFAGLTVNGAISAFMPSSATHAATKAYVDALVNALDTSHQISGHLTGKKLTSMTANVNVCRPSSATYGDYLISDFNPTYSGSASTRINSASLVDTDGNGFKESPLLASGTLGLDTTNNIVEGPLAVTDPRKTFKCIFISSVPHDGNYGGIDGTDNYCQVRANAVGLSGTFKAWSSGWNGSTPYMQAKDRLTHASVPYKRPDGTQVASNWADLTDGTLSAGIIISESSQDQGCPAVLTGTDSSGASRSINGNPACVCSNFSAADSCQSLSGEACLTDSRWTAGYSGTNCSQATSRIYCLEQ